MPDSTHKHNQKPFDSNTSDGILLTKLLQAPCKVDHQDKHLESLDKPKSLSRIVRAWSILWQWQNFYNSTSISFLEVES